MRKLLLLMFVLTGLRVMAQEGPLPKDFKFDMHEDMDKYTKYIVPCVDWLQQTPLGQHTHERAQVNIFVLHWLERNPDIDISLPEYSLKFNGINRDLLCLFLEGWIKHILLEKDTNITNCAMAGVRSMLDFYRAGKAASIGKVVYLENLSEIDKAGKLRELFDSGRQARNTYLYLDPPHGNKHDFKDDENYFGFHYHFINLVNPRGVMYRYMLEGYYNDWIETPDGSVTYPRLPPGNYNFRIQASMYPDFDHAVERNFQFVIRKAFWQENWFFGLSIIVLFVVLYLIVKQRERNLKNKERLERMRILFEFNHLKSQVNPHFLFNSFNTLTSLIEKDQKKALSYTEHLSELYHNILTHYDNDFVQLSEEFRILNNYISIQKGRFGDALKVNIDIPEKIMQTKKIVPLALQMLIENAIKHNVVSASSPLVINIMATENEITIRNIVHLKISKEKGEGMGLVNIKRRYDLLTTKTVSYGLKGNEYIVILPLL